MDFNQVILASLFQAVGNHTNIDIDENVIRHMFLNSVRMNRKKFHNDYGEIIICAEISEPYSANLENFVKNKIRIKQIKILEILEFDSLLR